MESYEIFRENFVRDAEIKGIEFELRTKFKNEIFYIHITILEGDKKAEQLVNDYKENYKDVVTEVEYIDKFEDLILLKKK